MAEVANYYVKCFHCGAKNKVPVARIGQDPTCGKCKQRLFAENSPVRSGATFIPCAQCQVYNKVPLQKLAAQPRCGRCKTPLKINLVTEDGPMMLSDQNFTETVLRSPFPFLVNFHSPHCGPCKLLNPTINKLAKDYEGRLKVGTFNVDANQHIPTLYRVGGTPTLVLFQRGKEVSRLEGYQPSAAITRWIEPHAW